MAASIKISELNSLTNLTDVDLFLVSDMESGTSKKVSYSSLKSNLTDSLSSAVTDLTGVVSQNRTDAEALVETVRAALQAAVDANATGYAAADVTLNDAIVVLSHLNEEAAEGQITKKKLVSTTIRSTRHIVTTSITTVGGLFPLLFDTFFETLAWAMCFGVLGSALIALLLIPSMFCFLGNVEDETKNYIPQ